jgi:O-antigen/teichoic acid export membrane protein
VTATREPAPIDVKEVVGDLGWYSATNYGLRAIGMARALLLVALLPLEIYGQMQLIAALTPYLLIPTFVGSGTAITQATARGQEYLYHHFQRRRDRLALIPAGLSLLVAGYYHAVEAQPALAITIALVGLLYPLTLQDMFQNVLLGRRAYRTLMKVQWPAELLATAATLAVAFVAPNSLPWLVLPSLVIRGVAWVVCRARVPVERRPVSPDEAQVEWAYIKQRSALGMFAFAASQADRLLVGAFFGFEGLALYSFARTAADQLNLFQRAALDVILQRLSARGEAEANRLVLRFALLLLGGTLLAGAGVDLLFSGYVLWFVPEKLAGSLPYLHWLLLAVCISGPGSVVATYFSAQKKVRWEWIHSTAIPAFYLGSMLVLIPIYGVAGVVYAYLARGVFVSVLLLGLHRWYEHRSGLAGAGER